MNQLLADRPVSSMEDTYHHRQISSLRRLPSFRLSQRALWPSILEEIGRGPRRHTPLFLIIFYYFRFVVVLLTAMFPSLFVTGEHE